MKTRSETRIPMKRRLGILFVLAGLVLVLSALTLYGIQMWQEKKAGDAAEEALLAVKEQVNEEESEDISEDEKNTDAQDEMTVVYIDGWGYIGYLSIPSIGLELPVMAEWSYEGLDIAPGRFSGSVFTDDLVIAGHNYRRHFSPIKNVSVGTLVVFTDMDGNTYYYEVSDVENLQPVQVEEMKGLTGEDDWDLTLFTCTTGGTARCAVRCVRVES